MADKKVTIGIIKELNNDGENITVTLSSIPDYSVKRENVVYNVFFEEPNYNNATIFSLTEEFDVKEELRDAVLQLRLHRTRAEFQIEQEQGTQEKPKIISFKLLGE